MSVVCAAPAREMSGVRNGYEEFERLGLDRWLAMLGGFHLASGACLVLDFGTAVTADFIAGGWRASRWIHLSGDAVDAQSVAYPYPQNSLWRSGG